MGTPSWVASRVPCAPRLAMPRCCPVAMASISASEVAALASSSVTCRGSAGGLPFLLDQRLAENRLRGVSGGLGVVSLPEPALFPHRKVGFLRVYSRGRRFLFLHSGHVEHAVKPAIELLRALCPSLSALRALQPRSRHPSGCLYPPVQCSSSPAWLLPFQPRQHLPRHRPQRESLVHRAAHLRPRCQFPAKIARCPAPE